MSVSICIASGKGGAGKSTLAANLGAALAFRGASVVIVDMDIGLRSQDALLALQDHVVYDLVDVANKDCQLDQALIAHPAFPGLRLLPAAQFARARSLEPERLGKILKKLKQENDFILLDSPAGIERGFRNILNAGTDEMILVTTPDDISIRDAERAAQVMDAKRLPRPRLIVNRLDNDLIRRGEMYSAKTVAQTLDLALLGEVPEDPAVYRSMLRHGLLIDYDCEARSAVLRIAARLQGEDVPFPDYGSRRIPLLRRLFHTDLKEVAPLDRN